MLVTINVICFILLVFLITFPIIQLKRQIQRRKANVDDYMSAAMAIILIGVIFMIANDAGNFFF